MKKALVIGLIMSYPAFGMEDANQITIGQKNPGDSLEDCKKLTVEFLEKMYKGTDRNVPELVDKQYKWLQEQFNQKNPEFYIIFAKDEKAQKLLACLACMIKTKRTLCVLRMMASAPDSSGSSAFIKLIEYIPSLREKPAVQEALTCIPKIAAVEEFMKQSGFQTTDFNPEACPKESWQGYKKILKAQ